MDDVKDVTGPEHRIKDEQVLEVGNCNAIVKKVSMGIGLEALARKTIQGFMDAAGDDWAQAMAEAYVSQNTYLMLVVFDDNQEIYIKAMKTTVEAINKAGRNDASKNK